MTTAFVLGGGGVLGAVEVGMLRALLERDITPDLVLGTSVGALNGAMVAKDPSPAVIERLIGLWQQASETRDVYGDRPFRTVRRAVSTRTHIYSAAPLKQRLREELDDLTFEDLPVRFQVCAASIERAAEHWFTSGPVVDAVIASAAVPGLLPPARIGDEHYLDGGIVNSIPVGRAVQLGATRVFVLQVGRIDRPLSAPTTPVGGGPGLLRDRPAAPVRPRDGRAAAGGRGPRPPRRGHLDQGRLACSPTATSPPCWSASTRPTTPSLDYLDAWAPAPGTRTREPLAAAGGARPAGGRG